MFKKKWRTIRSRMNQIERRIFAVMLCISLVNIISLLPSTILFLIPCNIHNWPIIQTALMTSIIATFLNTAVNPFVYLFVSS